MTLLNAASQSGVAFTSVSAKLAQGVRPVWGSGPREEALMGGREPILTEQARDLQFAYGKRTRRGRLDEEDGEFFIKRRTIRDWHRGALLSHLPF